MHRDQVFSDLAEQIAALPADRAVVAIDGVDGAGKTTFADALAPFIISAGRDVVRASIDGFHNPRAIRYQMGKTSPEGFFRNSYNYPLFFRALLQPFKAGAQEVQTARFDHRIDDEVNDQLTRPAKRSILLLDGIFLHRDELCAEWDMSLFLDVPFATTFARMAIRDGCDADPDNAGNERYRQGQQIYMAQCQPEKRATLVIDNDNHRHPVIRML